MADVRSQAPSRRENNRPRGRVPSSVLRSLVLALTARSPTRVGGRPIHDNAMWSFGRRRS
jgi:hypothetical protein